MAHFRTASTAGIAILLLAAGALLLGGCDLLEPATAAPAPRLTPLAIATRTPTPAPTPLGGVPVTQPVVRGTFVGAVKASGSLLAEKAVAVYPRTTVGVWDLRVGRLVELAVREGDRVVEGQRLGRIEVGGMEWATLETERFLDQPRANLADLQAKLALVRANPPQDEGRLRDARQMLEEARFALEKAPAADFAKDIEAAERRLRWAKDDAAIRTWYYDQISYLNNQASWDAAVAAGNAVDRQHDAEKALDILKATQFVAAKEHSFRQEAVRVAEQRIEDIKREQDAARAVYDLEIGLLARQIAEAQAAVERAEKASGMVAEAAALVGQVGELVAPVSGVVTEINLDLGAPVAAGQAVLTIGAAPVARAVVDVAEWDVPAVAVGQDVRLTILALDASMPGKVTRISAQPVKDPLNGRSADEDTAYRVEILLGASDPRARAGMSVAAEIPVSEKPGVLLAPSSAIQMRGTRRFVEVVEGDEALAVEVQVGLQGAEQTEIVAGLREGQMVVLRRTGLDLLRSRQ